MSSLHQIVIAHHDQARDMASKTFRARRVEDAGFYGDSVNEFKKHGRKFTTRVEKRLRKIEMGAR